MSFSSIVEQSVNKRHMKSSRSQPKRNIKFRRADTDYIYFTGRQELEKKNRYGKYDYAGQRVHAKEAGLDHWKKVYIVIGHRLGYYVPIKREDTNTWFIVEDPKIVKEYGIEAYVGNEIDKYNLDKETKDAWKEIIGEL